MSTCTHIWEIERAADPPHHSQWLCTTCRTRTDVLPADEVKRLGWSLLREMAKPQLSGRLAAIEAQRDELQARLDAVLAVASQHPDPCDQHDDDDPITCGWKRAYADIVRAARGEQR